MVRVIDYEVAHGQEHGTRLEWARIDHSSNYGRMD